MEMGGEDMKIESSSFFMKSFAYLLNLASFVSTKLGGALVGLGLLERMNGYGIKDDTEEEEEQKSLLFIALSFLGLNFATIGGCEGLKERRGDGSKLVGLFSSFGRFFSSYTRIQDHQISGFGFSTSALK